jgi:hypothetical protein
MVKHLVHGCARMVDYIRRVPHGLTVGEKLILIQDARLFVGVPRYVEIEVDV